MAIAIHYHVVPAKFPGAYASVAGWPFMEAAGACHFSTSPRFNHEPLSRS